MSYLAIVISLAALGFSVSTFRVLAMNQRQLIERWKVLDVPESAQQVRSLRRALPLLSFLAFEWLVKPKEPSR